MDPEIDAISTKLDKSLSLDVDDEKMEAYHRHIKDAKAAAKGGNLLKGLEDFKKAFQIVPSKKLKARIQQMEAILADQESESEDEEFVSINGLRLFRELYDKLYYYQREGISFLYGLYRDGLKGGILADDMGLGKTIQIITFLSGMYDAEHAKYTLLVMPTSLITNWTKEFAKWTPGMRVKEFHGASRAERTRSLEKVQRRGGAVITTYNMMLNNWEQLASSNGQEFIWDYMILDEAHKIKSTSSKTAKSAYAVPAKNRILITGTPVQNNLREMWALFDFACRGSLLGSAKTFKTEYENPITRAREKDATPGEKALGAKMSENLMKTIGPHFLRRTKAEVQKKQEKQTANGQGVDSTDGQVANNETESGAAVMPKLTRKNDLVVWTFLSKAQENIYRQFLSLDHIKELLTTTRSPLAELTVLKKLCDHPRMLSAKAVSELGLQECLSEGDDESAAGGIDGISDETLISESGKMTFLVQLLLRLRDEGHRTLVFARFRKVLDILQRVLVNMGFKVLRLDGTINKMAEREQLIQKFQNNTRYTVFLLTTQVGGVGITLTAANRVVIYDPSWNPATDAQAVDRAYRIGQTQNVVIYRLITCGTVEEKIYRRQVFKDSLIRQTTGDKKNPFRYFSKQDLKELFSLQETRSSDTQRQLQSLHSSHRLTDPELDEHIAHLHAMEMFGISDHDLMFSVVVSDEEEDEESRRQIETKVQKAEERMRVESTLHAQLAENMGSSTEPAWLRQVAQDGVPRSSRKREKPRTPVPSHEPDVVVDLDMSASAPSHEYPQPAVVDLDMSASAPSHEYPQPAVVDLDMSASAPSHEYPQPDVVDLDMSTSAPSHEYPQPAVVDLDMSTSAPSHEYPQPAVVEDLDMSVSREEEQDEAQSGSVQMVDESVVESQAGTVEECTRSPRDVAFQSGPVEEKHDAGQTLSTPINLTLDDGVAENQPEVMHDSPRASSMHGVPCGDKAANASICEEFMDSSTKGDTGAFLKNKRLSVLQMSAASMNEDGEIYSPKNSPQKGDFELQLDDSDDDDMFTSYDVNDQNVEAQQSHLLSRLQLEGSFDVDKSLADDKSAGSIIMRKKKKAAVIYDSEEEEDVIDASEEKDDHTEQPNISLLAGPGASSSTPLRHTPLGPSPLSSTPLRHTPLRPSPLSSTPLGSAPPDSTTLGFSPLNSNKCSGGNTSVASKRSVIKSFIEDLDDDEGSTGEHETSGEEDHEETEGEEVSDEGEEVSEEVMEGEVEEASKEEEETEEEEVEEASTEEASKEEEETEEEETEEEETEEGSDEEDEESDSGEDE